MSKTGKFHELTQAWKCAHTHMGEGERERPFLANQLVYNGQARGLSAKGHIINVSLPGIILNEADQGLFH